MVCALRESEYGAAPFGPDGSEKEGKATAAATASACPGGIRNPQARRARRRNLVLTGKGIASLYIMDREPLLGEKFADLRHLLKQIDRTHTVGPRTSHTWLDYALDKGYCEDWR